MVLNVNLTITNPARDQFAIVFLVLDVCITAVDNDDLCCA